MVRLFVAINPPERVRERIAAGTEDLRGLEGIRWVASDRVHLTLKFLGQVEEDSERPIAEELARIAMGHGRFQTRVAAAGVFPSIRRPRIIWIGLEPSPELAALQRDIEDGLADLGFERERRPFRPHLTLGRVRRGQRVEPSVLDTLLRGTKVSDAWPVEAVDLMRSHLLPSGAVYDVRFSAELAG